MSRLNAWMNAAGEKITNVVGTMWCAALFACLALLSLPDAVRAGRMSMIQWVAQTFLQLVLLSIILVGQNVQGQRTEKRDIETHDTVMASHAELLSEHRDHNARLESIERSVNSLRVASYGGRDPSFLEQRLRNLEP